MFKSIILSAAAHAFDGITRADLLAPHHMGRTSYPKGWRNIGGVPAGINRHTGKPHEHKREIARRKRQAARLAN